MSLPPQIIEEKLSIVWKYKKNTMHTFELSDFKQKKKKKKEQKRRKKKRNPSLFNRSTKKSTTRVCIVLLKRFLV